MLPGISATVGVSIFRSYWSGQRDALLMIHASLPPGGKVPIIVSLSKDRYYTLLAKANIPTPAKLISREYLGGICYIYSTKHGNGYSSETRKYDAIMLYLGGAELHNGLF